MSYAGTLIDTTEYRPLSSHTPNKPLMRQRDNSGIQYIYQELELMIRSKFNTGAQQPKTGISSTVHGYFKTQMIKI